MPIISARTKHWLRPAITVFCFLVVIGTLVALGWFWGVCVASLVNGGSRDSVCFRLDPPYRGPPNSS